jgi:hypothetical protein
MRNRNQTRGKALMFTALIVICSLDLAADCNVANAKDVRVLKGQYASQAQCLEYAYAYLAQATGMPPLSMQIARYRRVNVICMQR